MKRRAFETVAYRSFVAFFHPLLFRSSYFHFSIVRSVLVGRTVVIVDSIHSPSRILFGSSNIRSRFLPVQSTGNALELEYGDAPATEWWRAALSACLFVFYIILFPQFGLNRMRICERGGCVDTILAVHMNKWRAQGFSVSLFRFAECNAMSQCALAHTNARVRIRLANMQKFACYCWWAAAASCTPVNITKILQLSPSPPTTPWTSILHTRSNKII